MLKKLIFLTASAVMLFYNDVGAQTFSYTRISPAYVIADSVSQFDVVSYGVIVNLTNSTFNLRYIRRMVNVPSGWETAMCTKRLCYPPYVDTSILAEPLEPFAHDTMSAHFYPDSIPGQGTFVIRIERIGSSEFHEQTFGAIVNPIGIIQISSIAKEFSLAQNYPNPFNPNTKISFSIPKKEAVYLRIYDILGREVKTLINEELAAGEYEYDFEAKNMSSGFYYYSLRAGENVSVKKMVLVK